MIWLKIHLPCPLNLFSKCTLFESWWTNQDKGSNLVANELLSQPSSRVWCVLNYMNTTGDERCMIRAITIYQVYLNTRIETYKSLPWHKIRSYGKGMNSDAFISQLANVLQLLVLIYSRLEQEIGPLIWQLASDKVYWFNAKIKYKSARLNNSNDLFIFIKRD